MAVPPRLEREYKTVQYMLQIYCKAHHQGEGKALCADCTELQNYASQRLKRCPYGEKKPTCAHCPVHCYKNTMRVKVQQVMRYSGPKMIFSHPCLALLHLFDGKKQAPQQNSSPAHSADNPETNNSSHSRGTRP